MNLCALSRKLYPEALARAHCWAVYVHWALRRGVIHIRRRT
ncbi:hypothetical protein DGo_PE0042 (plasmid) [Deinococcus gobiensis I-0]|uniref:Uncharacterized protein n=1 Tax=Deinococcus gobiensis (strain DSM 21396 / JCM 16679 / CGMCC 1.7299 / I-0) TaxID=745776 RepID=H8H3T9_DEIGI|nr:hypothetical protein DGo_PE0042 [Deinococcus gobiensis I-0]